MSSMEFVTLVEEDGLLSRSSRAMGLIMTASISVFGVSLLDEAETIKVDGDDTVVAGDGEMASLKSMTGGEYVVLEFDILGTDAAALWRRWNMRGDVLEREWRSK